jgi:hypothetical protein
MPALDEGGKFAPGTFEEEADSAWGSILAIAAASGCGPADFLYIQVLFADIGNYGDLNTWWPGGGASPPEVQAGALPFGAKIELQAVTAPRIRPDDSAAGRSSRDCRYLPPRESAWHDASKRQKRKLRERGRCIKIRLRCRLAAARGCQRCGKLLNNRANSRRYGRRLDHRHDCPCCSLTGQSAAGIVAEAGAVLVTVFPARSH